MNWLALTEEYRRLRDAILTEFPELDAETLSDTLDGATALPDAIDRFIRDAREDEALAEALKTMLDEMSERRDRFQRRAERRRNAALMLMQAAELRKIERADFTAYISHRPPRMEINDPSALPDELCKFVRSPDRDAIKKALASGPIAGVHMTNGSETLSIRTK